MKYFKYIPALAVVLLAACGESIDTSKKLESSQDSFSYIYGYSVAQRMKQEGIDDLEYGAFIRGVRDGLKGDSSLAIKEDKMGKIYQSYILSNQEKKTKKLQKESQDFMAKVAKEKDAKSLSTKAVMKTTTKGVGPVPQAWDSVECYIKWTTNSGSSIIDSYKENKPFIGVISSLQLAPVEEAIQKSTAGSVFEVYFNNSDFPQLSRMFRSFNDAYGISIWKVELRKVKPGTKPAEGAAPEMAAPGSK